MWPGQKAGGPGPDREGPEGSRMVAGPAPRPTLCCRRPASKRLLRRTSSGTWAWHTFPPSRETPKPLCGPQPLLGVGAAHAASSWMPLDTDHLQAGEVAATLTLLGEPLCTPTPPCTPCPRCNEMITWSKPGCFLKVLMCEWVEGWRWGLGHLTTRCW